MSEANMKVTIPDDVIRGAVFGELAMSKLRRERERIHLDRMHDAWECIFDLRSRKPVLEGRVLKYQADIRKHWLELRKIRR